MICLCGKDTTIICNEAYPHLYISESPSQLHLPVGLHTLVHLLVRTASLVTVRAAPTLRMITLFDELLINPVRRGVQACRLKQLTKRTASMVNCDHSQGSFLKR